MALRRLLQTVLVTFSVALALALIPQVGRTAYHHGSENDSGAFLSVYPDKAGTKLDSCNLCHSGGSYASGGKMVSLGSCQWCHYKYGYDAKGDISATLNPYGHDFLFAGRSAGAVTAIAGTDSDGDKFSNGDEIAAVRYPGDSSDDPTKVPAPYRVYTREQLERMPQHNQFLLMNASKSTDFYAEYSGVTLESLLGELLLGSATGIKVISPDGFSQYHPLLPDANLAFYHVFGTYPSAHYYYDEQADMAKNPSTGWADYSAPSTAGRKNGDPITNENGLRLLLAIRRDGAYLTSGVLTPQNKLDGEGPFRIVPPQKLESPPDQRSTVTTGSWVWPYNPNADHNAGASTRTTTMIKVEPLPAGTTDINTLEAGWDYVDDAKIVVYGAIGPVPTVLDKIDALAGAIGSADQSAFKQPHARDTLIQKLGVIRKLVEQGAYGEALRKLQDDVQQKTDGCVLTKARDGNDWVTNCEAQTKFYWATYEIAVLFKIVA